MRADDPILDIALLGGLEVRHRGAPVEGLQGRKLQSLLAYLVLHHRRPVYRRTIAETFWPGVPPERGRRNLRRLLHELRRKLPEVDQVLAADKTSVRWRLDGPSTVDVFVFETLAGRARTLAEVQGALSLYRGPLLPSCLDGWIVPERERLTRTWQQLLARAIQLAEQGREYETAMELVERGLHDDPCQEALYRTLMRLHVLLGEPSRVRSVFDRCASALEAGLNAAPSKETVLLYERLAADRSGAPATRRGPGSLPLIGRYREWKRLEAAWRRSLRGEVELCLVTGDAGIGKTHIAEAFERRVRNTGYATLSGRCYEPERRLNFGLAAQLVQGCSPDQIAEPARQRLAPLFRWVSHETVAGTSPPPLEDWSRPALLEALTRMVLSMSPILIMVDDIQWCDGDSLEWLHHLLRRANRRSLLVLATLRPHEVGAGAPLLEVQRSLSRHGRLEEIALEPLSVSETAQLAVSMQGAPLTPELTRGLYRETEGNPLFVVEIVNAGLLGAGGQDQTLPRTIQTVFQGRLDALPGDARDLAGLAAVIGRDWAAELLCEASGRPMDTVLEALDLMIDQRILKEIDGGRYDFTHGRLRDFTRSRLSAARRRHWHRCIAAVLIREGGGTPDVHAQIAYHLDHAGNARDAARYHLLAGDEAQRVYALNDAQTSYRKAIDALADTIDETVWRAWCGLERVHETTADRAQQARDLAMLEQLAAKTGKEGWMAEALNRRAQWRYEIGELEKAAQDAQEAARLAHRVKALGAEAVSLHLLGKLHNHVDHDNAAALAYHQQAHTLARDAGDRYLARKVLRSLIFTHAGLGRHDRALTTVDDAIAEARRQRDRREEGYLRVEKARTLGRLGRYRDAIGQLERALPAARSIGDPKLETLVNGFLGMACQEVRAFDISRRHLTKAIELSRRTGDRIGESLWISSLGLALGLMGYLDRANTRVEQAIAAAGIASGDRVLTTHLSHFARLALEFERPGEAAAQIARCRRVLERHPDPTIATRLMFYDGWLMRLHDGPPHAAAEILEQALRALEKEGPDEEAQACRVLLAECHMAADRLDAAKALLAPLIERYETDPEVAVPQRAFLVQSMLAWTAGDRAQARTALEHARRLVLDTASRFALQQDRDTYLRHFPVNRRILRAARAGCPVC